MPDTSLPRYRCCEHCVQDPQYHEDNDPDSHTTWCDEQGCKTGKLTAAEWTDPKPWYHHGPNERLSQEQVDAHNAASHAWDGLAFKPRTRYQYDADEAAKQ